MQKIVIRRNGHIVVREHGEPDRALDRSDPLALAGSFRAAVELEEGLTGSQLFRALLPWSGLLARAGWIDFDAWIARVGRRTLRVVQKAGLEESSDEPPLDVVVLHPTLSMHRNGRVKNAPVTANIHWQTSGRYAFPRPNGFGGHDELCSLSLAPPESWLLLPLIINSTIVIDDLDDVRCSVLNTDLGGDTKLQATPVFFDTIVLGFLDDVSFHGSPDDIAKTRESVMILAEEARAGHALLKPVDLDQD